MLASWPESPCRAAVSSPASAFGLTVSSVPSPPPSAPVVVAAMLLQPELVNSIAAPSRNAARDSE